MGQNLSSLKFLVNPTSSVLSVPYDKPVILYLRMFIQPDSGVVNITIGDDFRDCRDQNSYYQHLECLSFWTHCCGLFVVYSGAVVPYTTLNKHCLCYRKVDDINRFEGYP